MARIAIIHISDGADDIRESALPPGHTLAGLYAFPGRSELRAGCLGCGRGKLVGWGRHRTGYMRCATCGKRNPNVRRWFAAALFDWFGANIIGEDAPTLFKTPEGYHADNG